MGHSIDSAIAVFKPGLYQHYKGGLYSALFLLTHHHTRKPMVVYTSLAYGGVNARPLVGWPGDEDGWFDWKKDPVSGIAITRFTYIGDLPSDTPAAERLNQSLAGVAEKKPTWSDRGYRSILSELLLLRTKGEVSEEIESQYADRLNAIWWQLTDSEQAALEADLKTPKRS